MPARPNEVTARDIAKHLHIPRKQPTAREAKENIGLRIDIERRVSRCNSYDKDTIDDRN